MSGKYIGNSKYKWGGGRTEKDIKNGIFDCSSFVHHVFKQQGINLGSSNPANVNTRTLRKEGTKVDIKNIQPGDLIFFDTNRQDGHVGIWLGDGKWIGAQSSTGVDIVDMSKSAYWTKAFKGHVRRVD